MSIGIKPFWFLFWRAIKFIVVPKKINTTIFDKRSHFCYSISVMLAPESKNHDLAPEQSSGFEPVDNPLMDKSAWHQAVEPAVAEAQKDNTALCAVLIDLDYFKDVNDLFGHAVGDKAIDKVIAIVRKNLRSNRPAGDIQPDIISGPRTNDDNLEAQGSRLGGDEFGILAHTDRAGAEAIVRRISEDFDGWLNQDGNEELQETGVGMGFGISELRASMTGSELLKEADENLYKYKIDKLPDLTEHQKRAIEDAKAILSAAGVQIRFRDFPKYGRKYPELFYD